MGRAKELMIEMEQDPFYGVSERFVSAHLFKNRLIHEFVMKNGFDEVCSYCGDYTKVLPLKSIVEEIDRIILQYFGDPDDEGVGWDSRFEDDTPGFHSEAGGYIVPNNKPYYDDMHELLFWTGFEVDNDDLESDISSALSYHSCLIEKDPYGLNDAEERVLDWRYITTTAMNMAKEGRSLDEMMHKEGARLDYLKSGIYTAQYPLQIKKDLTLYRTVNYKTKRRPLLFRDLTSPPVRFTCNLRMSIKGDSVFYGAASVETAKREALSAGSDQYTYIGEFKTKHPMRLLDLTGIPEKISIFDHRQYLLLLFLRYFCNDISAEVKRHDAIMYAPTQLVTYYFRNKLHHYEDAQTSYPIDGILYSSSKDGTMNAVLFYDNNGSREHMELVEWQVIHNEEMTEHTYRSWMKYVEAPMAYIRKIWMS